MLLYIVFACSKVAMLFSHVFFQKITSSAVMFMSMIHFKFIFVNGMKQGSKVIFSHMSIQCFNTVYGKDFFLLHSIALVPLSKINRPATCEFIAYFLCSFNLCVYFQPSRTALIIVGLQQILNSGSMSPLTSFFFIMIALYLWVLYIPHIHFRISLSICLKN